MLFPKSILGVVLLTPFVFTQIDFNERALKLANKSKAPIITMAELKEEMAQNKVLILDTREPKEFKISHLPNAINIGFKKISLANTKIILQEYLAQADSKNHKVVIYCSLGYRSGKVADKLNENGFKTYNLLGGIFNWVNEKGEVVDMKGEQTQNIHGYNKKWSRWLKRGNVVY